MNHAERRPRDRTIRATVIARLGDGPQRCDCCCRIYAWPDISVRGNADAPTLSCITCGPLVGAVMHLRRPALPWSGTPEATAALIALQAVARVARGEGSA